MTETIEVWYKIILIPKDECKNYSQDKNCILIHLPKTCCGHNFELFADGGDENTPSRFNKACQKHFHSMQDIWNFRVKNVEVHSHIHIIDPLNDGAKCVGFCQQWVPMASANQPDNTFICWACRQPH